MLQIIKLPLLMKKEKTSLILFLSLIAGHLFFLTNLRFTAWPEMLSYPYLINQGYSFYGDIVHPFVPLLVVILSAVYRLFELTPNVLQLTTIFFIFLTDVIFYSVARRLIGNNKSLIAFLIYLILQISLEGNGLWFDLAVTPFFIVAFYSTYRWFKEKTYLFAFLTGLIMAMAILIKLSSLWLITAITVLGGIRDRKGLLIFLATLFLTGVIVLLLLFPLVNLGQLNEFFYWGLVYPLFIVTSMPGYIKLPTWKQIFVVSLLSLPILVIGVRTIRDIRTVSQFWKKNLVFSLAAFFYFAASLFAIHRFSYFHLQPALPFLSLAVTLLISQDKQLSKKVSFGRSLRISIFLFFFLILFLFSRIVIRDWQKPARFVEPSVVSAARVLSEKLPHTESIYFYNVPSQYFVLANLLPIKPWVDTFPWYLELDDMQEKMITILKSKQINWVVFSAFKPGAQYDLGAYKPALIDDYIWKNFEIYQRIEPDILLLRRK